MEATEVRNIRDQLERAMEGGAWHGPALWEIVGDMTAEEAASRPLSGAHSPWEIVLHVATWLDTPRRRLDGEPAEPTEDQNWPEVPEPTRDAWDAARQRLADAHASLQAKMEGLDDGDLRRRVPGHDYDLHFMLHGVVQHTLYHAGQLALLKKALRSRGNP
jgi:uncharacterized damage-inducible protein DinB